MREDGDLGEEGRHDDHVYIFAHAMERARRGQWRCFSVVCLW